MTQIKKLLRNIITYKILIDIFFLLLLVTSFFIIAETLLPGIVSAYISPFYLFTSVFLIIALIALTSHEQNIYTPTKKSSKILFFSSVLIFIAIISISSFSYGYLFGSIIVILATATFVLLYLIIQEDFLHKN